MALRPLNLLREVRDNFNLDVDPDRTEHENAAEVTRAAALLCAAVAAEPLPWMDLAVIVPLQVKLVVHVGKIYGFEISTARARALILEIGGAVALSWGARQLVRGVSKVALPLVGGILTAPLVYGGTFALGQLAERYFRSKREDLPPLTPEERREWTKDLVDQGRRTGEKLRAEDLQRARDAIRARIETRRAERRGSADGESGPV